MQKLSLVLFKVEDFLSSKIQSIKFKDLQIWYEVYFYNLQNKPSHFYLKSSFYGSWNIAVCEYLAKISKTSDIKICVEILHAWLIFKTCN